MWNNFYVSPPPEQFVVGIKHIALSRIKNGNSSSYHVLLGLLMKLPGHKKLPNTALTITNKYQKSPTSYEVGLFRFDESASRPTVLRLQLTQLSI
jgi:hypothetical protein